MHLPVEEQCLSTAYLCSMRAFSKMTDYGVVRGVKVSTTFLGTCGNLTAEPEAQDTESQPLQS